jgi:hypothetical protein
MANAMKTNEALGPISFRKKETRHYSRSQLAVIRVYDEKSGRANTKNSNHRRARHVLRQQDDSLLSALSIKIVVLAT